MKNKINYILIVLIMSCLSCCDILDSGDSKVAPLDSKIEFKIIESYEDFNTVSVPQIFLKMQTEKEYGCMNYSIKAKHKLSDKSIMVDIAGIDIPDICLTAIGPAVNNINLGQITGFYEIEIKNKNFSDKYNLLISDTLLIVDGKETADTEPKIRYLWRYPKNSFEYLCGTTLDTSLCTKFIDTLQSIIDIKEFTFPDFGEIPYPNFNYGYKYNSSPRYFYYKDDEDFDRIQLVIRGFMKKHSLDKDDIGISIINWMNRRFNSWLISTN